MTKKEIRNAANQKFLKGKDIHQTFEELQEEVVGKSAEDIAKILRFVPTLEKREKYKIAHTILILTLGLTVMFKALMGVPIILENGINWLPIIFIMPIINIILVYGVATYQGQYYNYVAIFTVIGLLRMLKEINNNQSDLYLLVDFGIAGILIGLGYYLSSKMNTAYKTVKVKYTSREGKVRVKDKIKFVD